VAAMNKTQRKELIEILERKYQKKVAQISVSERAKAEKESVSLTKKCAKAQESIEKQISVLIAELPDDVRPFIAPRVNNSISPWAIASTRTNERVKQEYGDLREKLDDLPERLFLASVQGDDVAKIMAEFAALD
jgi:hypothetical protein